MNHILKVLIAILTFTTYVAHAQNNDPELKEYFQRGLEQKNSHFIDAFGLSGEKLRIYNEVQDKYINNEKIISRVKYEVQKASRSNTPLPTSILDLIMKNGLKRLSPEDLDFYYDTQARITFSLPDEACRIGVLYGLSSLTTKKEFYPYLRKSMEQISNDDFERFINIPRIALEAEIDQFPPVRYLSEDKKKKAGMQFMDQLINLTKQGQKDEVSKVMLTVQNFDVAPAKDVCYSAQFIYKLEKKLNKEDKDAVNLEKVASM